ncbi:hypothetical protein [Pseudolysinimonas sp.]
MLLTLVVGLGMTACVGGEPLPTLPPTPDSTPIFGSEEEALAAAEAAYAAYQAAVDVALTTLDDSGLSAVASGEALVAASESVKSLREEGGRQEGKTAVVSVLPTDLSSLVSTSSTAPAQVYACLDLSDVRIVNADGSASQSGIVGFPMIVTFEVEARSLLVVEELVWDGDNFC